MRTSTLALIAVIYALVWDESLRAALSEPPNVLYGTITFSNVVAGADRTDLVIEARRTSNGPPIATFRLGSDPAHGDYYFLELPLETTPSSSAGAATAGTPLVVALRDDTGDLARVNYLVGERGKFQRTDFVIGSTGDNNGLPDPWELARFGAAGQDPNADPDGDGRNNLQEYIAGTNPLTADAFTLGVVQSNSQIWVSYFARRAEGPGYEGRARYYSLETSTNVNLDPWKPVAGFTNTFGNNQNILFVAPGGGSSTPAFFRGRTSLQ